MATEGNLVGLLGALGISESKFMSDSKFDDAVRRIVGVIGTGGGKNLEYEFRLGYMEDNVFNTDTPDEFYEKILQKLRTNTKWQSVSNVEVTDYFVGDVRHSIQTNGESSTIKKTKLASIDFRYHNTPFDIRFSISREEPVTKKVNTADATYVRKKTRTVFKHKFWTYDISKIETTTNGVKETTNEIELDLRIDSSQNLEYLVSSSLLKLGDLANMCEKQQGTEYLEFLGERKLVRQ